MPVQGNELGELLIDLGLVTPEELSDAVKTQEESGERLTLVLSNMGLVNERQLKDALELQYGVNFITLARTTLDDELVKSVPEEVMRKYRFVPVSKQGTQSTVAMVDPDDLIAADAVRNYLKSGNFKKLVCTADDFDFCLQQMFAPPVEEISENGFGVESEPESVKETKKGKAAKTTKSKSKKGGVKSLFGDDEEDEDEEEEDEDEDSESQADVAPEPETQSEPEPVAHSVSSEESEQVDLKNFLKQKTEEQASEASASSRAKSGRSLFDDEDDDEDEDSSPAAKVSEPEPAPEPQPAPEPEPAPEPLSNLVEQPEPELVEQEPEPVLVQQEPEPELVHQEPEPVLVHQEVEPELVAEEPPAVPTVHEPEPEPEPAPTPKLRSSSKQFNPVDYLFGDNASANVEIEDELKMPEPSKSVQQDEKPTAASSGQVSSLFADLEESEEEKPLHSTDPADFVFGEMETPINLEEVVANVTQEIFDSSELSQIIDKKPEVSFLEEIVESELSFTNPAELTQEIEVVPQGQYLNPKDEVVNLLTEEDQPQSISEPEPAPEPEPEPEPESEPEPEPAPAPAPQVVPEPVVAAASTPEPEPVPVAAAASEPVVLEPTILSLAQDILRKAIELNCSDIHLEPDANGLTLRYMLDGDTLADVAFPGELTGMMIACYKHLAGMDQSVTTRPQDKRFSSPEFGNAEIRVTTIPQDQGEMIAISIKRN